MTATNWDFVLKPLYTDSMHEHSAVGGYLDRQGYQVKCLCGRRGYLPLEVVGDLILEFGRIVDARKRIIWETGSDRAK